jgi:hypothetical protein
MLRIVIADRDRVHAAFMRRFGARLVEARRACIVERLMRKVDARGAAVEHGAPRTERRVSLLFHHH